MNKTDIEWVRNPDGSKGFTSNPISGLCPVECKLPDGRIYCYARKFYLQRFKNNKWFKDARPMFWIHRLVKIHKRKKPAGIFICSTYDLFHPFSKENESLSFARNNIFKTIEACPQHRFYILTKFPQNIDRPMPDNVWLGVSITGTEKGGYINFERQVLGFDKFLKTKAKLKFISFEPLFSWPAGQVMRSLDKVKWVIVGRLTEHGKGHNPELKMIWNIINTARDADCKIFLKNNLKSIWGENLIQEMPNEERNP